MQDRALLEDRLRALDRLRRLKAAQEWRRDPAKWIAERLGEFTWSKQREILASVATHRRTAVPSCYASGKSWLAARIVAWWIDTHPVGSAFVVTTATTGSQVEAILWRELSRAHAAGRLPGRLNKKEWYCPLPGADGREEMVAFGRKPADMDSTAFQGIHARYVLVILDEAAGIPKALVDAAEGLIANEESRILAIGNPEQAASPFQAACSPGSGWNVIRIPASCTPNFTGEAVPEVVQASLVSRLWVEEKRRSWGEDNPLWKAKVEAEFPDVNEDGLIPISWIRAAQDRKLEPGHPVELGMDVGGGGDRSVICLRRGPVARITQRTKEPDTMKSCGLLLSELALHGALVAKVDEVGIGRGVADRGKEAGKPVRGVNVGLPASNPEAFANLRAEGYWALRERFRDGDIALEAGPETEDLVAQLVDLRYTRTSRGQIQIESKQDIRRRGKPSPDEADALMLAFLQPDSLGAWVLDTAPAVETLEAELERLKRSMGLPA